MRVDLEQVLSMLQAGGERTGRLYTYFKKIAELETYTLLLPPFQKNKVKEDLMVIQQRLDIRFPNAYYWFMLCCDGGLLFTNELFSIDDKENEDNDLFSMNLYLRQEKMIPEGTCCIGCTNYGAFILLYDGQEKMALWDREEENTLCSYADFYEWLEDVLQEALYLKEEKALPVIEDDDDEE